MNAIDITNVTIKYATYKRTEQFNPWVIYESLSKIYYYGEMIFLCNRQFTWQQQKNQLHKDINVSEKYKIF